MKKKIYISKDDFDCFSFDNIKKEEEDGYIKHEDIVYEITIVKKFKVEHNPILIENE